MADLNKIFNNVNVAIVASDADLNVTYANKRCKEVFKALLNQENFVGKNMRECHKPETIEKISALYDDYRQKKKPLDYYTIGYPGRQSNHCQCPGI